MHYTKKYALYKKYEAGTLKSKLFKDSKCMKDIKLLPAFLFY